MSSFKSRSTRQLHNQGSRLFLKIGSTKTEDWLHVLGQDSDIVQRAHKAMKVAISTRVQQEHEKGSKDEERGSSWLKSAEGMSFMEEQQYILLAQWFNSWSFDEPCTPENRLEFLRENPTFAQQLDNHSGNFDNFSGDTKSSS